MEEPNEQLGAQRPAPSPPRAPSDSDGDAPAPAALFSSSDDDESVVGEGEFEFEFPFVSRESPAGTAAPADELFADGRIRTFYYYPVFGHLGGGRAAPAPPPPRVRGQLGRLFLEESRARSSSVSSTASTASTTSSDSGGGGGGGLEGAPPESYCLWTPGGSSPSPRRPPRKSGSTGSSMARWRRISELVVGRSHSDGKEKFVFFPAPQPKPRPKPSPASGVVRKEEADTAHRAAYGGVPGGAPRRTFLPYREELVGFFANVNGITRSHQHPF